MMKLIKNHKIITLLLIFITVMIFTIIYQNMKINDIQKENIEIYTNNKILKQNKQALDDSLKQKASDLLEYKVFVNKLSADNITDAEIKGKLNNKILLLESTVRTLRESSIISGSNFVIPILPAIKDTNIVRVNFGGSFKKVNVTGYTEYNLLNKNNNFTMKIEKEPFEIKSYLFFNKKDSSVSNIIHIDGDSVRSTAVLDIEMYKLLINGLPAQKRFFDRLSTGLYISYNDKVDIGAILKYDYNDFSLSSTKSYYNWDIRLNYTKSINDWFSFFRR